MNPTHLFLELNRRCNLACQSCDFWKYQDRTVYTMADREMILREFANIGGRYFVTCGGEPMLDIEDFFHLHRTAKSLGLIGRSVVNGTKVHPTSARRLLAEGPREITVSLDSHDPAKHDEWRGQKGSWAMATDALRTLVQTRLEARAINSIYAMVIVSEQNYRELPELFHLCLKEIGVDKLKLNIVQPAFGKRRQDEYFDEFHIRDPEGLMNVITEVDGTYGIKRNPKWLDAVRMYCESIVENGNQHQGWGTKNRTRENICNSADRNIMINTLGVGRLCFHGAFPGKAIKEPGDLTALWQDATWRDDMRSCKRYCGISHSVRREPSTLRAA
jgi:MoaA/NifB/PqqE/SkfB family radical SAM enzyme